MIGGILLDGGGEVLRGGVELTSHELLVPERLRLLSRLLLFGGDLFRRDDDEA